MRSGWAGIVLIGALAAPGAPAGLEAAAEAHPCAAVASREAAPERKCSARLLELLGKAHASDAVTVWIFLRDRGPLESGAMPAQRPSLSPQAMNRRQLCGARQYDSHDFPVYAGYVDSLRVHLLHLRHVSRYFNAVSAEVDPREIPALCSHGFVKSVDLVAVSRCPRFPDTSPREPSKASLGPAGRAADLYGDSFFQLNLVGATELLEKGYNGSGGASGHRILIGILDTGFKLDHSALQNVHVEAQWDFIQGDSVTSNQDSLHQPVDTVDQEEHGTAILGVIGGHEEGSLIGPAWGAAYLLAKTEIVSREIRIEEDHWVAGIEWADSAGARVVTSSLGYIAWYTQAQLDGKTALCTIAADIAVSHGIVVVNAAGNEDGAGLIAPADGDSVLAIGAVDRYGVIAPFSSRGPTADGRIKPDFAAMGMDVQSVYYSDIYGYSKYYGTSLSAPMVAGICALLLDIHPDWNPMKVREALRATSSRGGFPNDTYGYGIPNAALASAYPGSFAFPRAFPNPFSVETKLQLSTSLPGRVTVRVYDCRGALVKTLADGRPAQRAWTLSWDGTNENGIKVAGGVYFIRINSRNLNKTIKAIRVP